MKPRVVSKLAVVFLFVLLNAMGVRDAAGLVIYRIGGEDRPLPSSELGQVDFHQLSWTDFRSDLEEDVILMDIGAGGIQPMELTPDLNIAATALERGGAIRVLAWGFMSRMEAADVMIDGDPTTAYGTDSEHRLRTFYLDLGGRFGVDKIRFYPREHLPERYLEDFDISINDGDPRKVDSTGRLILESLVRKRENRDVVADVEFPTKLVRYIRIYMYRPVGDRAWEVAEIEVYGTGYVPKAHYTSDIIDLGDIATWGQIRWAGRQDPSGKVWIQTRSGTDEDPTVYWRYTGRADEISKFSARTGQELTRSEYNALPFSGKAGTTYDTENWSFWTAPYDFSDSLGVAILSPGPRRFFQIKVDFRSIPTDGGQLDFLEFTASIPPPARQVMAEISPLEVRPGEMTHFTYAVRASIREDDTGFDRLELPTPTRVSRIDSVRIDGVDVAFTVESVQDDCFVVGFPKMGVGESGALLEVVFDTIVLRYGTAFMGKVFDSGRPHEARQMAIAGNTTDKLRGDDLSVRISLKESLLQHVRAFPNPFTPNGDDFNDEVYISYDLFNLTGYAPIRIEIYDLSGNLVEVAHSDDSTSGRYSHLWDGTNRQEKLVPPGLYIYRITVDADKGRESKAGILSVAY